MPSFPWLARNRVNPEVVERNMRALRTTGVPYTEEDFKAAPELLANKSELDAVIAYLQGLGTTLQNTR